MKMNNFTLLWSKKPFYLMLVIALAFTSCQKGDPGPQGAQGPQGPQGSAGPKGDKGDPGTANVYYSSWLDVQYTPSKDQTTGDTIAWTAGITATRLTKPILDSGMVKVYLNAGSSASPAVFPLPITDLYALLGLFNINIYFTLNKINIYADEDASTFTNQGTKYFQYRYIIIPGGTPSGRLGVDWNNYESVKAYLGLKD